MAADSDLHLALTCLRTARGWTQKQLAAAVGMPANLLSDYECGRKAPRWQRLSSLVAAMGLGPEAVEEALRFVGQVRQLACREATVEPPGRPLDEPHAAPAAAAAAAADGGAAEPAASGEVPAAPGRDVEGPAAAVRTAVAQLRFLRGWSQRELAAAAGLSARTVSRYERGTTLPSIAMLRRLAQAVGASPAERQQVLTAVAAADAGSWQQRGGAARIAAADPYRPLIEVFSGGSAARQRQAAQGFWEGIAGLPIAEQRQRVERDPSLRGWAVCELICDHSRTQAHHSAEAAADLAQLALHIARLGSGEPARRSRLEAYALGHLANAQRILGELSTASATLRGARRLWHSVPADPEAPLAEGCLPSFEISLLLDRDRLDEATELADRLLVSSPAREAPNLLVQKGIALRKKGLRHRDAAALCGSMQLFVRVAALVRDGVGVAPAVARAAFYNHAVGLFELGRFDESLAMLPEVRGSMLSGGDLDALRLGYLEGSLLAALGRRDDAIEKFAETRSGFLARGMDLEGAYLALELAPLELARGRKASARALAGMAWDLFGTAGLPEPQRQALGLLRRARRA